MRVGFSRLPLASFVLAGCVATPLIAATTENEKWALELRKSDNRQIKLLGDRWYTLVKMQEWSDATGKFTVDGKFISLSPDEASVTLLVARRTESGRVEKEVVVPFDRLSKTCQARVMRIVRLRPKIEERVAEVAAEAAEEDAEAELEGGRGSVDEEAGLDSRAMSGGRGDPRAEDGELPATEPEESASAEPARPVRPPLEEPGEEAGRVEGGRGEAGRVEGDQSVENPYGGTRWIGRDQLVDDQRFAEPTDPSAAATAAEAVPAYAVAIENDAANFPLEREVADDGWREYFEPLGDESHLEYRLLPTQPVAGETARLLVIPSSIYGRPQPKVFVRLGDVSADGMTIGRSPNDGPAWVEMPLVGGRIMDARSERMVPIGETEETPRAEQPGESHYLIGITFPPGKSVIDLKFEDESFGTVAFRMMEVDALGAPSSRSDPVLSR